MLDILQPQRFDTAQRGFQVDVYDGDRVAPETLLFTSGPAAISPETDGIVRKTHRLTVGGHRWSIAVTTPPSSRYALSQDGVAWIGLSGLIGSLLLAGLVSVQTQAQRRVASANTALARANEHLAEQEQALLWAQRTALLGSWRFDPRTGQSDWSEGMFLIWGLNPKQRPPHYEGFRRYIHPDDWHAFDQAVRKAAEQGEPYQSELRIRRPDGEERTLIAICTPELNAQGQVVRLSGTNQEITDLRQAKLALEATTQKLQAALQSMSDAVFISDAAGTFVDFNEAFASFHKFANRSACVKRLADFPNVLDVLTLDGDLVALENWVVPRALRGEAGSNAEYILKRRDTGESWIGSYTFAPIRNAEDDIVGSVITARDITERLRLQKALREESIHDALTGLFNRRYLDETLPLELARRQRDDSALVVAMLDLDHFKSYNDDYGHEAGDCVLRTLGDFLQRSLRQSDLSCRYGGEEFTIVLHGASLEDANKRLDALRQAIMQLQIVSAQHGELPKITVSIGATLAEPNATKAADLLDRADVALYQAKEQGRNRVVVAAASAETAA